MASLPERSLYPPVLEWLGSRGASGVREEVRTHGRSRADLTALLPTRDIATVEVKVRDWRRASRQALLNRYCAHESWIAVWWIHATADCEAACRASGLGLLSVEVGSCQQVVAPMPSVPYSALADRIHAQLAATE